MVKVLDFGMVKDTGGAQSLETVQLDDIEATSAQLTQVGMFAGTPAYASPEMATGDGAIDARTDIYALGCVAFWLLTGRLVFPARDPMSVLAQHISALPDRPSAHAPDVPPALDDIVLRCLAKAPEERFRSADELSAALVAVPIADGWTRDRAEQWWRTNGPRAPSSQN